MRSGSSSRTIRRPAYTLFELVIALSIFTILLSGLTSVLFLTTSTLDLRFSGAARTSESVQMLSVISNEVAMANRFYEQSSNATEFSVADRDGDGEEEIVRFEFSASPDDDPNESMLIKSMWYSATREVVSESIAKGLSAFEFEYEQISHPIRSALKPLADGEQVLFVADEPPSNVSAVSFSVLLVIEEIGLETDRERSLRTLFSSFGWQVETVGQGVAGDELQQAVDESDVVFVTAGVDPMILQDRLRTTSKGVVCENSDLGIAFGFGSKSGEASSGRFIELINDTVRIAGSQVAGGVEFFDSTQPFDTLTSVPTELAPDLRVVARLNDATAMALLDRGDELHTGELNPEGILGYDTIFNDEVEFNGFYHNATRASVPTKSRFTSLSACLRCDSTVYIRLGIYADNGHRPGELLAETELHELSLDSTSQWYTLPLPTAIDLPAGDYWVAATTFGTVRFRYRVGGESRWALSTQFPSSGMMNPWPSSWENGYDAEVAMYASFSEIQFASGKRVFIPIGGIGASVDDLSEQGKSVLKAVVAWSASLSTVGEHLTDSVSSNLSIGQYLKPSNDTPFDAWIPTRIAIRLRPIHSAESKNIRFNLYQADDNGLPSDLIYESDWFRVQDFAGDDYRWFTLPVEVNELFLSSDGICIVVSSDAEGESVELAVDQDASIAPSSLLRKNTEDGSWEASTANENIRIYVFGRTYDSR